MLAIEAHVTNQDKDWKGEVEYDMLCAISSDEFELEKQEITLKLPPEVAKHFGNMEGKRFIITIDKEEE